MNVSLGSTAKLEKRLCFKDKKTVWPWGLFFPPQSPRVLNKTIYCIYSSLCSPYCHLYLAEDLSSTILKRWNEICLICGTRLWFLFSTRFFFRYFRWRFDCWIRGGCLSVKTGVTAAFYQEYLFWCKTLATYREFRLIITLWFLMIFKYQSKYLFHTCRKHSGGKEVSWWIIWKMTSTCIFVSYGTSIISTQSRGHEYCNLSMLSVVY